MSFKYYLGREFRVELSCDIMSFKFGSLLLATRSIIMRTITESNLLTYFPLYTAHVTKKLVSNF